ncbi:hypothetical protein PFISCL1PPCAC_7181, partial [Pristionchus fissidentatus]
TPSRCSSCSTEGSPGRSTRQPLPSSPHAARHFDYRTTECRSYRIAAYRTPTLLSAHRSTRFARGTAQARALSRMSGGLQRWSEPSSPSSRPTMWSSRVWRMHQAVEGRRSKSVSNSILEE